MAVRLDGSPQAVEIDPRFEVRAPGFTGRVELADPPRSGTRSANPRLFPAAFTEAIERAELHETATMQFTLDPPSPGGTRTLRGPRDEAAIELRTRARKGYHQIVLCVDESGVATWHHSTRDPDDDPVFLLRSPERVRRDPDASAHRGVIGVSARLVKTFLYAATDPVVGGTVSTLARSWERTNRPYRLRSFEPGSHRHPPGNELDANDLRALGSGRALLFVHGTFSTAATGFGALPDPTLAELHRVYGGRVFALDHPSLADDPIDNAREFLARIPDDIRLDLDLVAHSRGGLVARAIAGEHRELPADPNRLNVGRIVFAGTPNAGSRLLSPGHLPDLIDSYTTALNVLAFGPVAEVLDAVIVGVKVLAHGSVDGLRGLTAGDPDGLFMSKLDARPPGIEYYGLAADFEPPNPGVADYLKHRAIEGLLEGDNDLVVAADSVDAGGMTAMHRFAPGDGVHHSGYFEHAETSKLLRGWLTG